MKEFSREIVVNENHPSLPGHFPGNPIVPGVVLLDRILAEIQKEFVGAQLISIASAKFQRPIAPNEPVTINVRVNEQQHALQARFAAIGSQGPVAEGRFTLQLPNA